MTVQGAWIGAGIGSGLALSVAAVAFAYVGLSPQFSWVPETPFLLFAAGIAIIDLAAAGGRTARASRRVRDGAMAAALAGALGGLAAGVCYVVFDRSAVNLIVLPLLGALAGTLVGTAAALFQR